ncbi:MAG TPA: ABC transporter ATP-binding protein [Gammaproteobacteria bacterium]|nr:ABC transporter ATP-binding protein [Gammaproteobacteria bacterium]
MIQATNLTKRFKDHTAVDGVTLNVDKGQIFGLLGPNAAGKTTVIRMLCGIIESDEGEARINGMSVQQAKADFGYVAQHFSLYEELSVWENLEFYAHMYNISDEKRLSSLLDRYDLAAFKNQLAGLLSGGYQRRLGLVCALAHDPKVLFLDEPTAGIDPVTRKLLWDDFYRLSAEGKTLFITTHYMEEAQRCHQLAFISSGRIVAEGSPVTIKQAIGNAKVYSADISYLPELQSTLLNTAGMILVNQFGNELRLVVTPETRKSDLESTIGAITGKPCTLTISEPNLEDVFIALTQKSPVKH